MQDQCLPRMEEFVLGTVRKESGFQRSAFCPLVG